MLKISPYRLRRDAIEGLFGEIRVRKGKIKVPHLYLHLGKIKDVESRIWDDDKKRVQQYVDDFPKIFPKFFGGRASAKLESAEWHDEDGEPTGSIYYKATVSIPIRCRLSAIVQDIDYSSPVWINIISVALYFLYR
ncbi:MAG: hypothetical protein PHU44_01535 [Syntrophales bacterium]|nr:hypothetical protein [Syntrophales bacterium]MDD5641996.1 hypothetical protein [Syntrophales bacterium]